MRGLPSCFPSVLSREQDERAYIKSMKLGQSQEEVENTWLSFWYDKESVSPPVIFFSSCPGIINIMDATPRSLTVPVVISSFYGLTENTKG